MITISILTLFPDMFVGPFDHSIVKRAKEKGLLDIRFVNIRDFGIGRHTIVDDTPYGGGVGMVMKVDVLDKAIAAAKDSKFTSDQQKIFLLRPHGKVFSQSIARKLSHLAHLILICGHYEGLDERITAYIDGEISMGDFVLTGGEIPAMAIIDAVTRLIPGVLKPDATAHESFTQNKLEHPHYTTPQEYNGMSVPEVLLSGDHKKIDQWREEKAKEITQEKRPDL